MVVTDACRNMLILLSLCKRVLLKGFCKTKIARAMSLNDVVILFFSKVKKLTRIKHNMVFSLIFILVFRVAK